MSTKQKPKVKLTGQDGNVFNLIGVCRKVLQKNGMAKEATELVNRCFSAGSYEEALAIMGEYLDVR